MNTFQFVGLFFLAVFLVGLYSTHGEEFFFNYKYYHLSKEVRKRRAKIRRFWERLGRR